MCMEVYYSRRDFLGHARLVQKPVWNDSSKWVRVGLEFFFLVGGRFVNMLQLLGYGLCGLYFHCCQETCGHFYQLALISARGKEMEMGPNSFQHSNIKHGIRLFIAVESVNRI